MNTISPKNNFNDILKNLSPAELERVSTYALKQAQYKKTQKFIPDKVNCTYWWEIIMNPDQAAQKVVGYSKFEGFSEARDADHVLCSKVEMLYKNGYMHRSKCITIYRKQGAICNKEIDSVVLVIKPEAWEYLEAVNPPEEPRTIVELFLSNFRDCIFLGKAPQVHLRPIKPRGTNS